MRTVEQEDRDGRTRHVAAPGNDRRVVGRSDAAFRFGIFRGWSVEEAAALLAACIFGWAAVNLLIGGAGFATPVSEEFHGSEEAASALVRFFAALVLGLFLVEEAGWRMRWIAGGMVVLGLGHLVFGYLEPVIQSDPLEPNESLYEVFVTQTFACSLFAIGLLPGTPSRLLKGVAVAVPASLVTAYIVVFEFMGGDKWMPPLVRIDHIKDIVRMDSPLEWITPLHWLISALPLGLAIATVAGTFWQSRRGLLRGWILFAMVLLVGAILHDYLWPSMYGSKVFTTADMLNLTFAAAVAVGGVGELRRVASERKALLAAEQERTRRLGELARLKSDFSAMVAHELDSPLAAIRKLNEMIGARGDNPEIRGYAIATMKSEIEALNTLVGDVRADTGRDEFAVHPRATPVGTLLDEAETFAGLLPGVDAFTTTLLDGLGAQTRVWADPERVAQVLRNLLTNAAKYSPPGAPIILRASLQAGRVRLEVVDRGPGVCPDDVELIFEKFGRGRDGDGRKVDGNGLGLYLSRRIVKGHGADLTVRPAPGGGSVFGFDLEVAR